IVAVEQPTPVPRPVARLRASGRGCARRMRRYPNSSVPSIEPGGEIHRWMTVRSYDEKWWRPFGGVEAKRLGAFENSLRLTDGRMRLEETTLAPRVAGGNALQGRLALRA